MSTELLHTRISVTIHALLAVLMGFLSSWLANPLYAGAAGIALVIALGYSLERIVGKRGFKWWLSNGLFIYLLLWLVTWTYFFNISP